MNYIYTSLDNFILERFENNLFTDNDIIEVFHRSDDARETLTIDKADEEYAVFGKALYFSSHSDITSEFGSYVCKYKIKLDKPLNLNQNISIDTADKLLQKFINIYNLKIDYYDKNELENVNTYSFSNTYDDTVQYGEFFLEIQDIIEENPIPYIKDFIESLGYNSFYHYSDHGTNFIEEKGDYGFTFGIYNDNDVKFVSCYS